MNLSNLLSIIESYYSQAGYLTVFLGSVLEGTPLAFVVPASIFAALGGFYAKSAEVSLIAVIIAGWTGTWLAFMLAYMTGFKNKTAFLKLFHQDKQMKYAHKLFDKYGLFILAASYITPFIRFWIAFTAGKHRYNFRKYVLFTGVSSFIWTTFIVMIGYIFGAERNQIEKIFEKMGILGVPVLLLIITYVFLGIRKEWNNIKKLENENIRH